MRIPLSLAAVGLVAAWFPACGLASSGLGASADGGAGGSFDDVLSGSSSSSSAEGGVTSSASGSSSGSGSSSSSSSSSSGSGASSSSGSSSSGSSSGSSSSSSSSGGCSASAGCYAIPSGWTFIAFATNQGSACPSGFANAAPTNLDESPNASSVCTCGTCSVTTQPTCQDGQITSSYDIHGPVNLCGSPGTTLGNNPGGACDTDLAKANYDGLDLKFDAPGPSGGQCSSAGQATGTVTYGSQDRECTADSATSGGCSGDECTPSLSSPYMACIVQNGSNPCPAGSAFTQQHLVGTGSDVVCSACGCNVTASCGGRVALFTDTGCTQDETDIGADGACHAGPAMGAGDGGMTDFNSYKYIANAPGNVGCASTGSSSATTVTLSNEQTVCCVP